MVDAEEELSRRNCFTKAWKAPIMCINKVLGEDYREYYSNKNSSMLET